MSIPISDLPPAPPPPPLPDIRSVNEATTYFDVLGLKYPTFNEIGEQDWSVTPSILRTRFRKVSIYI